MLMDKNAKIFDLHPQKGTITVGADANLAIANPDDILDNWKDNLISITDWNAYLDFPAIFPQKVINKRQLISNN